MEYSWEYSYMHAKALYLIYYAQPPQPVCGCLALSDILSMRKAQHSWPGDLPGLCRHGEPEVVVLKKLPGT